MSVSVRVVSLIWPVGVVPLDRHPHLPPGWDAWGKRWIDLRLIPWQAPFLVADLGRQIVVGPYMNEISGVRVDAQPIAGMALQVYGSWDEVWKEINVKGKDCLALADWVQKEAAELADWVPRLKRAAQSLWEGRPDDYRRLSGNFALAYLAILDRRRKALPEDTVDPSNVALEEQVRTKEHTAGMARAKADDEAARRAALGKGEKPS